MRGRNDISGVFENELSLPADLDRTEEYEAYLQALAKHTLLIKFVTKAFD